MRFSSPISGWWSNGPLWFLLFLVCAAVCFCPNASFIWLSGHPLICLCGSYTSFWLFWVRPADWFSLSYLFLILLPYLIAQSGCLPILFDYFPFPPQDHLTPETLFMAVSHRSSGCWLCHSLCTYLVVGYGCIPLVVNSFLLRLSFSD